MIKPTKTPVDLLNKDFLELKFCPVRQTMKAQKIKIRNDSPKLNQAMNSPASTNCIIALNITQITNDIPDILQNKVNLFLCSSCNDIVTPLSLTLIKK